MWLKIADRLGMSLARVKAETSISDFYLWMAYLEKEVNDFHREDYYWAQIAMMVMKSIKPNKKWKVEQFLIPFERRQTDPASNVESKEEMLKRIRKSQQRMGMIVGVMPPP